MNIESTLAMGIIGKQPKISKMAWQNKPTISINWLLVEGCSACGGLAGSGDLAQNPLEWLFSWGTVVYAQRAVQATSLMDVNLE